jgi:gliding motility-associated-like protein
VPNAFTPNGDGANDSFGLAIVEGIASVEKMEIYSRWGQKVFSSSDPNARWDGTIDGQDAPSDVYIFVIYYRGGDGALKLEKGDVTLLR